LRECSRGAQERVASLTPAEGNLPNETSAAQIGRRESARGAKKTPYQSLKS